MIFLVFKKNKIIIISKVDDLQFSGDESCTSAEQGRGAVVLGTGSPPSARPWGWVYHFGNISNIKTPDPSVEIVQGAPHNCIVSCSYLMAVALGMVFCCCPSTSRSNVLCVQRYSSVYLGCNDCLFEWLLPFCQL